MTLKAGAQPKEWELAPGSCVVDSPGIAKTSPEKDSKAQGLTKVNGKRQELEALLPFPHHGISETDRSHVL